MAKISERWKDTPDGKRVKVYIIRYQDRGKLNAAGKPVHRQESFPRKKLAEARLLQLQNELASGTHIATTEKLTVAEVCEHFMRHQEDRARDGRIGRQLVRTYDFSVRKSIVPHLGGKIFADLRVAEIEDFYTRMVRQDGLSPRTGLSRVSDLRSIEDFAIKRGFATRRPVTEAKADLRGIPRPKIRTFTPEQVKHLLKTAATLEKRHQKDTCLLVNCFVNIAAFCGLRFGEIAALSLDTVDLDGRMIHVRHSYSRFDGLKGPKTAAGLRDVPMPEHVADLLRAWIKTHYVANERRLIFLANRKAPPQAYAFHANNWRPLLKRAGLYQDGEDGFHFHALRHFAASWLVTRLPLTDVAQILGHSKYDMTLQVYAHPITSGHRRHEAVEDMASLLLPVPNASDPAASAQPVRH